MEGENSRMKPMEKPSKIMRKSVYTFLQNYQYFTSTSAILAFPFSISLLLSQALLVLPFSSSLLPTVYNRLETLFGAAGFPPSSQFFSFLNLKLSQTLFSFFFTLPFSLTSLLITKASIIQALNYYDNNSNHHNKIVKPSCFQQYPSFSSILSIFNPLLLTYIFNSFLVLSTNATLLSFLSISFNFLEGFGFSPSSTTSLLFLSSFSAIIYSIALANTLVICNFAMVLSGIEGTGGLLAVLKACVMVPGRVRTALSLAVPVNVAMAGIEALFQYRIVRAYRITKAEAPSSLMAMEGFLIAYLYSIFVVLDTIVSFIFYKSCKTAKYFVDQEGKLAYRIVEITEEDEDDDDVTIKVSKEVP